MSNAVLARLVAERAQANETIDRILEGAASEDRELSEAERDLLTRQRAELERLEPQVVELVDLEETRGKAADARAHLVRQAPDTPAPVTPADPDDPGEYQTFAQFARDAILTRFANIGASVDGPVRQRAAARHQRAVEQVLTSNVAGLIQPQYLAQIMQVIDRQRPIVDTSRKVGLSSGKIQYPRITAKPTVDVQAAEKTEAGVGTMTVIVVEKVATTYITSANFSWQTITWSNPDALALWFDLAAADYAAKTDANAGTIIATGVNGPVPVATDDLAGWTAAISTAAGLVYADTGRYADTIYAAPDVGYGLIAMVSAVSPVFLAVGGGNLSSGQFGSIGGLRLVVSKGMPAGKVTVGASEALLTAETPGSPVDLRAVEPSIGGMEVGIIGAFLSELIEQDAFVELTPPVGTFAASSGGGRRKASE